MNRSLEPSLSARRAIFVALAVVVICLAAGARPCVARGVNWKRVRVLVYTKNGKGYVHDNIPSAVNCLREMARRHGFAIDVSDDPSVFAEKNLRRYTLLVFASTNNDVFDTDAQRLAFRRYIEAGGGFVGIHSVVGTERDWRWFKNLLGGTFAWHPKFQRYVVRVIDSDHPSAAGLPRAWERSDECYFMREMYPGARAILAHDLATLNQSEAEQIKRHAGSFADLYPAAWHQPFDGGHVWITALGHDKADYEDPIFVRHITGGLRFVASRIGNIDFRRAYAASAREPVRY